MLNNIIFATDFSENNQKPYEFLIKSCKPEDEVTLLHVICNTGFSNPPPSKEEIENEVIQKKEKLKILGEKLNCKVKLKLMRGDIINGIINYTKEKSPNFLIIGSHKFGFFDKFLNKDCRGILLKNLDCPILCC